MKGTVKAIKKVVLKPQLSVNKLAEYLTADSSRRKKILQDAKYPEEFKTTRYKEARLVAKQYIAGKVDKTYVQKGIASFKQKEIEAAKIPNNEFQVNDNKLSAIVLEQLLAISLADLKGVAVIDYAEPNKKIMTKGLAISVYPDLLTTKTIGNTPNVGCIKLSLVKKSLSDESQKYVGVLLYEYAKKYIVDSNKGEVVGNKLCMSLDIFKQQFAVCPPSTITRLKKIEDACEEIVSRWDSISNG